MDRMSTKGQMVDQVDLRNAPHSGFDRSNHNYGTGKLGTLIPVRVDEVYPGDRIKGRPEIVENFEPLAAPLMGSMVLKQESFFVPYIQLWRHGYKFFTGKNGFNEPMPSVSPRHIFDVYNEYVHSIIWSTIGGDPEDVAGIGEIVRSMARLRDSWTTRPQNTYSDVSPDNLTLLADYQQKLSDFSAVQRNVFGNRKMLDLVDPAFDALRRVAKNEQFIEMSARLEDGNLNVSEREKDLLRLSSIIGDALAIFFEFFHGASSLCDYLGWPVVTDVKSDVQISEYGIINLFQYAIYRNTLIYGSFELLEDYILPKFSNIPLTFNTFKAYYLVWYWNYRDQLLETGILDPEEDEFLSSTITDNVILYCTINRQRCWFKDTYTTALTNTGDGNLLVPISSPDGTEQVDVTYYNGDTLIQTTDHSEAVKAGATIMIVRNGGIDYKVPMNYLSTQFTNETQLSSETNYVSLDLFDRVKRLRSQVQKRLILGYEADDVIWSSFMVRLSNVRMHIPELLGRGRSEVQINTIVNNTSTSQQIAGDKTATAWAHCVQSDMDYFAEEWGLFLTIKTTMPIQSYAGGTQRLYLKRDRYDYMWPEFATMGMDAVYNCELAAMGSHLSDTAALGVFGYQGRYYDLKSRQDEEHGRLLTDLNYLTFSREFDNENLPKLNYIFVHCWPRLDGFVIESPSVDVFRYDCYNAHAWERRLPVPSEIVS